jgi:hypothetical protein
MDLNAAFSEIAWVNSRGRVLDSVTPQSDRFPLIYILRG